MDWVFNLRNNIVTRYISLATKYSCNYFVEVARTLSFVEVNSSSLISLYRLFVLFSHPISYSRLFSAMLSLVSFSSFFLPTGLVIYLCMFICSSYITCFGYGCVAKITCPSMLMLGAFFWHSIIVIIAHNDNLPVRIIKLYFLQSFDFRFSIYHI